MCLWSLELSGDYLYSELQQQMLHTFITRDKVHEVATRHDSVTARAAAGQMQGPDMAAESPPLRRPYQGKGSSVNPWEPLRGAGKLPDVCLHTLDLMRGQQPGMDETRRD